MNVDRCSPAALGIMWSVEDPIVVLRQTQSKRSKYMSKKHQRSVLVTGGAAGLGAGICRRLAKDGYAVTIGDLPTSGGRATLKN